MVSVLTPLHGIRHSFRTLDVERILGYWEFWLFARVWLDVRNIFITGTFAWVESHSIFLNCRKEKFGVQTIQTERRLGKHGRKFWTKRNEQIIGRRSFRIVVNEHTKKKTKLELSNKKKLPEDVRKLSKIQPCSNLLRSKLESWRGERTGMKEQKRPTLKTGRTSGGRTTWNRKRGAGG